MSVTSQRAAGRRKPTLFADPYKKCVQCGRWIDGVSTGPGPATLVPCGHRSEYQDVCPSWSPVTGCGCASYNASTPQNAPIVHEMRPRSLEPDGKVY